MILDFNIQNSCRSPQERERISLTFRNAVLDFYGGVEHAKKSHDFYRRNPKIKFQDWTYAYHHALQRTKPLMSVWERGHTTFQPNFH